LNYLLQQSTAQDQLAKLQSFYEEIRELSAGHPGYRLADFFDHLDTLRRHGLVRANQENHFDDIEMESDNISIPSY
jgi:hypothetical protein